MDSMPPYKVAFLWKLAERIVPETGELEEAGRQRFETIIDQALADRPQSMRRQFAIFLGVLRWSPTVRYGAPFERLSGARQDAVLSWFQDCPVGLLRKGFWGLKAMVFMGYYGQRELWPSLGYSPRLDARATADA